MNGALRTRGIPKALIFACLVAASGASYALDISSGSRDGRTGPDGAGVVITVDQKSTFLAYVKRHQMSSDLSLENVAVGDVLPDSGVRYYEIPLYYGAPFYRCAVIGREVVIVDPRARRVIEVVD